MLGHVITNLALSLLLILLPNACLKQVFLKHANLELESIYFSHSQQQIFKRKGKNYLKAKKKVFGGPWSQPGTQDPADDTLV